MKKWIIGFLIALPMFVFSTPYVTSPYYALFPCFDVELYNELVAIDAKYDKMRSDRLAREARLTARK